MSEENKALVRRFIDEVWNQGKLDACEELLAADHVDHDPARAGSPGGPAGTREFVAMYRTAFPDAHLTIEELVAEGEIVAIRWRATGTQSGELMGVPPSGKAIDVSGMGFDRVSGGKIAESWANWDALGMLGQIGASSEPG